MRSSPAPSKLAAPAPAPQLALCLWDQASLQPAAHVMTAAGGGVELHTGTSITAVLSSVNAAQLELLVVDNDLALPGSLEVVASVCPQARIVLICDAIDEALLELTERVPGIVGFVARSGGRLRTWELGYLVRRVLVPEQEAPGSHELLCWGASTRVFRKGDAERIDKTIRAVDIATGWHGVSDATCEVVAAAARELLTRITVDPGLHQLPDELVPTLRLTVDPSFVALDLFDPFVQITRPQLFRALRAARAGAPDLAPVDRGLHELFKTASILRIDGVPGRETRVSWMLDRGMRVRRSLARSLYLVEGA